MHVFGSTTRHKSWKSRRPALFVVGAPTLLLLLLAFTMPETPSCITYLSKNGNNGRLSGIDEEPSKSKTNVFL